jgi:hypothetical protein
MSFVKRADGITYSENGHYMSRGTIEQVKNGSFEDTSQEQESWLKVAISAFMSAEDSLQSQAFLDNLSDEYSDISNIWGTYHRARPHFNEDYFWPNY